MRADARRSRVRMASLVALPILVSACVGPPKWRAPMQHTTAEAEIALTADDPVVLDRDILIHEVVRIPMPKTLRPCCILGDQAKVRLGPVPVPFVRMPNMQGRGDLGRHAYDSGIVRLQRSGERDLGVNPERNGVVYTCRGGFIDIAHVRDWSDWTLYLGSLFASSVDTGVVLELPDEGGPRRVELKPIPMTLIEKVGLRRISGALAQWTAFQLSIWHEIITWYGWRALRGWSEEASAYSPEDLYSNLVGIRLAGAIIARRGATSSEGLYNEAVDLWLQGLLAHLGALPRYLGRDAIRAVDGLWWDSSARLPDKRFVIRRHFELGDQHPWLIPEHRLDDPAFAKLRASCGDEPDPLPLTLPHASREVRFADWVTVSIELSDRYAERAPFPELGRTITQEEFPAIVAANREQNREEFGPDADRPD